jgi:hypothetical protein
MTISTKHKFASSKSDSGDASLVQPSNWNDEHDITLAAGKVLGRDTSGAGLAQELPIAVDSTGKVGIGTSSPDINLRVSGSYSQIGTIDGTVDNRFVSTSGGGAGIFGTYSNHPLVFYKNNAEGMRIDSSGNVGIGTSAPGYKLTVGGLAAFGTASGVYGNYADMRLETATGYGWRMGTASTGSTHGYFYIQGSTDNFVTSFIDGLSIGTSGNVGIGTSSPIAKLEVYSGSLGTSDGNQLEQARFTSTNSNGSSLRIFTERDGAGSDWETAFTRIQQRIDATDMGYVQFNGAGNLFGMSFGTSNIERMRIDSAGNVGIGTSSPSSYSPFTVAKGTVYVNQNIASIGDSSMARYLRIHNVASGGNTRTALSAQYDASDSNYFDLLLNPNGGNVGIGTSVPTEKLDVVGNVTISGSITKGSGSFKIDHPLKPDTHHLVHSFVEAPTADNIYRGRVDLVDGVATVDIDEAARLSGGTFVALNTNTDCWVNNKTGWTAVRATVSGSILSIEAQDNSCADTVSWLVIGERHDQTIIDANWTDEAGRVITEPQKDH